MNNQKLESSLPTPAGVQADDTHARLLQASQSDSGKAANAPASQTDTGKAAQASQTDTTSVDFLDQVFQDSADHNMTPGLSLAWNVLEHRNSDMKSSLAPDQRLKLQNLEEAIVLNQPEKIDQIVKSFQNNPHDADALMSILEKDITNPFPGSSRPVGWTIAQTKGNSVGKLSIGDALDVETFSSDSTAIAAKDKESTFVSQDAMGHIVDLPLSPIWKSTATDGVLPTVNINLFADLLKTKDFFKPFAGDTTDRGRKADPGWTKADENESTDTVYEIKTDANGHTIGKLIGPGAGTWDTIVDSKGVETGHGTLPNNGPEVTVTNSPDRSITLNEVSDGKNYGYTQWTLDNGYKWHFWGPEAVNNFDDQQLNNGDETKLWANGVGMSAKRGADGITEAHAWGPDPTDNFDEQKWDNGDRTLQWTNGVGLSIKNGADGSTEAHGWGPNPKDNFDRKYSGALPAAPAEQNAL